MCGIAGFSKRAWPEDRLDGMLERIAHRGPDGRGTYVDNEIALGNNLLAIVDIGNGRQPFTRSFGGETFVAVYNGEIYNYRDLRRQLVAHGLSFSTDCDTEVALAAYAVWGEEASRRFDGQWALAVWETTRERLFLTRDPLGIKPLFYHERGGALAFASEPKALLSLPGVPKRPDLASIREYFLHGFAFAAGYSLSHRSFFEGITSLPPGHSLLWTPGSPAAISKYVESVLPPIFGASETGDVVHQLSRVVRQSVEDTMIGDAPIGVALSGGLDSSVITAVAARVGRSRGNPPLLASCIAYRPQARNDDARHAALLADWLQADAPLNLVYSYMDRDAYLSDVDGMIAHFDEPHWEVKQLAMYNNYRVLKREGAKVVLTGEGADELFFGYYHRFPGFRNPVIHSIDEFRVAWSRRIPDVERMLADTSADQLRALQEDALARFYAPIENADPDRRMQAWYIATFLHWLLLDNDRCSMAFSLEGRFPFLNRAVQDLALRIPPSMQLGNDLGEEKLILRRAFADVLPESIWRERKKAPLPSPLNLSFHGMIRDALEMAIESAAAGVWEVLDRRWVDSFADSYARRIAELESAGLDAEGGDELTRYLQLDEPWSVRTPHAFGLLTFLRWWHLNFE